tara:strand:+ start:2149 stop:3657 length:1509 start_codon:yes stop_codon:yes gene_type:complete
MGIGYFQLTVTSEQDKYLVGNPEFTYFKAVYKKHTNFAKETFNLNFVGETFMESNNNLGKKLYCTIPKNGDLLHRMYLVFDIQSVSPPKKKNDGTIDTTIETIKKNVLPYISIDAQALIESIEIKIGDQTIDKHTGEWMHIYNEISLTSNKNEMLCDMINTNINIKESQISQKDGLIYIPLIFWFNRNPGLSLPLIALQNSDVKIDLKLNSRSKIDNKLMIGNNNTGLQINSIYMLAEYIHLDNQEKLLFSSKSHEYLIEQVQFNNNINVPLKLVDIPVDKQYNEYQHKFEIPFQNPIKELFWAIQDDISNVNSNGTEEYKENGFVKRRYSSGNHIYNYWFNLDYNDNTKLNQMIDGTITLNGIDMFEPISGNYFNSVLKYQYYNGYNYKNLGSELMNNENSSETVNMNYKNGSGFYCFSFALNPMDFQPSGSLNFSKIDKAELKIRVRRNTTTHDEKNTAARNGIELNRGNEYLKQKILKIYGVNYNILKIVSGHAGLAFN